MSPVGRPARAGINLKVDRDPSTQLKTHIDSKADATALAVAGVTSSLNCAGNSLAP
jgi:hypothetical protein